MKIYIFGNNLYQLLNNKRDFYYEWVLVNPSDKDLDNYNLQFLFDYENIKVYSHENNLFYVVKSIGDFLVTQTNNISASAYEVKDMSLDHLINEKKIICNYEYLYNERLKIINEFGKKIIDYLEVFSLVSNKSNNLSLMDEYKISDSIKELVKNKTDSKILNIYLNKTFSKADIKSFMSLLIDHQVLSEYLEMPNNLLRNIDLEKLDFFSEKAKRKSYFSHLLCMITNLSDKELTKMGNKFGFSKEIIEHAKKLEKYYDVINNSEKIDSVEQYNKIASLKLEDNEFFLKEVNRFSLIVYNKDLSKKTDKLQRKWLNFLSNELDFKSKKELYSIFLES